MLTTVILTALLAAPTTAYAQSSSSDGDDYAPGPGYQAPREVAPAAPARPTPAPTRAKPAPPAPSLSRVKPTPRPARPVPPGAQPDKLPTPTVAPLPVPATRTSTPAPVPEPTVVPEVVPQPDAAERYQPNPDAIYRDSRNWRVLSTPGMLTPGGQIINLSRRTTCSVGFIVIRNHHREVLTAGHCGSPGDLFGYVAVDPQRGHPVAIPFGRMLISYQTRDGSRDYGLIDAGNAPYRTSPFRPEVAGTPMRSSVLPKYNPTICQLGYRSGMSCGDFIGFERGSVINFYGISDHGDSGGPVYAKINGSYRPIGMTSYGYSAHATKAYATSLEAIVDYLGLTILY
ncbi:hypothetical protein [Corynebacterium aquilae]|uniref:hypothetical protein n=1 Tax=Corynebacterium aquilae TaxID=203263 RepID=UPI0012EE44FE|nr:hypothetical protein [Corynebacterium aquilae]